MKNIKYVVFFILMIIPFCFVMAEGSLSLRSKLKVTTLFNGSSEIDIKDKRSINVNLIVENIYSSVSYNNRVETKIPSGFDLINVSNNVKYEYDKDKNVVTWYIDKIDGLEKENIFFSLIIPKEKNISKSFFISNTIYSDGSVPVTNSSMIELKSTPFIKTKEFKTGISIIIVSITSALLLIVVNKNTLKRF